MTEDNFIQTIIAVIWVVGVVLVFVAIFVALQGSDDTPKPCSTYANTALKDVPLRCVNP